MLLVLYLPMINQVFPYYLRLLAIFYGFGALIHIGDVLDLRLQFSQMGWGWRLWILYLLVGDIVACVGLALLKPFGEKTFLLIAFSQLFAYIFLSSIFGNQAMLIRFHLFSLLPYLVMKSVILIRNAV